jgi:hypothetical protein
MGADIVVVQSMQCTAEPGHAVTAQRARMVDAKHPMLVAIKGDGLAPGL